MTITKPLRNHQIPYRWSYPVKLLIEYDSKTIPVALLKKWQILDSDPPSRADTSPPPSQSSNWPEEEMERRQVPPQFKANTFCPR